MPEKEVLISDDTESTRDEMRSKSYVASAASILEQCVQLDAEKKSLKKQLDGIEERLAQAKERAKDLFISMGVKSMKYGKSNVYIAKTIWTGVDAGVNKDRLAQALVDAGMEDYITCNSSKLSSYVREIVREHPELCDSDGNITASPDEIIAVLPAPFNQMFRVSEKVDIHVRK